MRTLRGVLAGLLAGTAGLGVSAAEASPPAGGRGEPLHLQAQAGWLAEAEDVVAKAAPLDEGTADAAEFAPRPVAARAAILAAARAALAGTANADLAANAAPGDVRVHATRYGPYVVQFAQRVDGVEVYGARVNVLLDRSLAVRAITGGAVAADASRIGFARDATTALRSAAGAVDGLLAASPLHALKTQGQDAYFRFERSPTFVPGADSKVRRLWYPTAQGLVAAYHVQIAGRRPGVGRPLARAVIVADADGRVLSSSDLVHDLERPFRYRVFADRAGYPYVDPYGFTNPYPTRLPSGYLPDTPAPMSLLALAHAGISTGDPWLADGATQTLGNNVDAFFNADPLDADGNCIDDASDDWLQVQPAQGDFRAPVTSTRTFDYAFDANDTRNDYLQCDTSGGASLPPTPAQRERLHAKIVQAFYAVNWLHDLFYDLGFDETAGNLQADNYGRGGVGGDPLHVSAGVGTTFAAVSEFDGDLTGLYLGINTYSQSRRDVSALDFGVLAHEWSHTMFGRLTSMQYVGQQGALNEGIADFVGLILSVRPQDRHALRGRPAFSASYAIGAYMNRDYEFPWDPYPQAGSPGYADDTYYHGIRRFPHSADLTVNPLTFKHIGMDHPLPDDAHAYDWKGRFLTNAEIHTAGEVWTEALWQCSRKLLAAAPPRRFYEARDRFLSNLVASLKLAPADADYVEARDMLLAAIRADSEADYRLCRAGFAERGMGAGALAPPRYSVDLRGAVESFDDAEYALGIVDVSLSEAGGGDGDGVLDRGEAGTLAVTVKNTGFSSLRKVRVRAQAVDGAYAFPDGHEVTGIALAPGASYTATFAVSVRSAQPAAELGFDLLAMDQRRTGVRDRRQPAFRVNYDRVRDGFVDTLATEQGFAADWTSQLRDGSYPGYCYYTCEAHWQRTSYLGEAAYVIGDVRAAVDAQLVGVPFQVSSDPLRIVLRHDYDFDRLPGDSGGGGAGTLEVSVDGGEWEPADAYLTGGTAIFAGSSSGWRSDTLDFGTALAGRTLQLRWYAATDIGYFAHFAHWAIARVEVQGAAQPMFTTLHADLD
ncbi:M36 family metallopeptidase [Dokdonella ginsengisoli]|uniref:M36 family metallopeptidase n=1 Tax=Dokdonella ginsengisoli TaxID=363846 RepID=A0ABV9QUC7_9GAMM